MKKYLVIGIGGLLLSIFFMSGCTEENSAPICSASADKTGGYSPLTVTFSGHGEDKDGEITSYHWNFGDGESSTKQDPIHTFYEEGTYFVTYTITDDDGDMDSMTISIEVNNIGEGLVGYWSFNEGSGTIINDQSDFGNDGIIYGARFTNGVSGKGLSFQGDDYAEVDDDDSLDISDVVTITGWINMHSLSTTQWHCICNKGDWFLRIRNYGLWINVNGHVHSSFAESYDVDTTLKTSLNLITENRWYFIVSIIDCNKGRMKIYVDGVLEAQQNITTSMVPNDDPLQFGRFKSQSYGVEYANGIIDEVRIYNRALTEEEIEYLYENP
jgi:PKD repeat protein